MLACARIGAVHSVVFGGFSRRVAARPHQRCAGRSAHHRRRRLSPRPDRAAQAHRRRGARRDCPTIEHVVVVRRRAGADGDEAFADMNEGRDHWWHRLMEHASARLPAPKPMDAEDLLFILYTSGTTGKPKGIVHTTGGYLTQAAATTQARLRPQGGRRLLVHRRRRLGHRPLVRRVRPARQRRHGADVRGRARLARERPLLGICRALRRDHPLHRAHRDPRVHEMGHRAPGRSTICPRSACSAPSASRSTRKRGCGTTSTSAAAAARSWTPGGRPRPARS